MPAQSANKAILAAILAALVSLVTALQDRTSLETMKALDWVLVVLAAIVAGLTVYVVPNRPSR